MEKFKGTKGKWALTFMGNVIDENGKEIVNPDDSRRTEEENLANAKLIAAAPELLEALEEMVRMYEIVMPAGGWQGVYEMSIFAIKKVTE